MLRIPLSTGSTGSPASIRTVRRSRISQERTTRGIRSGRERHTTPVQTPIVIPEASCCPHARGTALRTYRVAFISGLLSSIDRHGTPIDHTPTDLERDLGPFAVLAISIGAVNGSGIFILPVLAIERAGSDVVLVHPIAGLLVVPAALNTSETATAMPETGGTYLYAERDVGPLVGPVAGVGTWFSLAFRGALALVGSLLPRDPVRPAGQTRRPRARSRAARRERARSETDWPAPGRDRRRHARGACLVRLR